MKINTWIFTLCMAGIVGGYNAQDAIAVNATAQNENATAVNADAGDDDDWAAATLRPGDVLSIEVFRVTEFTRTALIEENGTFLYPFCGEIQAEGRTPREVAKEIANKLSTQITNPQVFVNVTKWSPRRVYLLGEIKSSSSIELPTYGRMTALQAISSSGGFTESADLQNVVVIRRNEKTQRYERLHVDASALMAKSSGSDTFRLRPNDTILVPKAPPISITGEVKTPGFIYVDTQNPPLLSEFIMRAGGFTQQSEPEKIIIVRSDKDGKRQYINASLHCSKPGIYDNDVTVYPGDYILVTSAIEIYVLGQVNKPGSLVPGPNKVLTASRAIALSGGFKASARESSVKLIRGNEMKTLNLRKIFAGTDYLKRDVELKNGDIIFVDESIF